ncbi:MAG: ABC transporter ATP-binding protein [Anaerolineae bacterium]|jgi:ABC-type Fe3+/spermidine/putrescine transport system ATPase subunit|nr:ABC transporter ATP-binding protein [Anaerolineae bacterium]
MTQVELQHLSKHYRHTIALDDLSLTIPPGQITALLGPSGCGKTTTLKLIAGLITPSAGEIHFDHMPITAIPAERRNAVMVFQDHLLFPHLSIRQNIAFGLQMRRMDRREIDRRVEAMLQLIQLPEVGDRRPDQLSGGQQQRVALARALITSPRVLLLDEPLSNLDAHLREEMRQLIAHIQRDTAITTILVTHDQQEATLLADHIALLFEGRLEQWGVPVDFYRRPQTERAARFFGGLNFWPGQAEGDQVQTVIGRFRIATPYFGAGTLTIRPEHLMIVPEAGENTVQARIIGQAYIGTGTRYTLEAGGVTLTLLALSDRWSKGETVWVSLPPDDLWVL